MLRLIVSAFVLVFACWPANTEALDPARPSQIVTLTTSNGSQCLASGNTRLDHQVLPSGTLAAFTIPANQVLVVTGVSWNLFGQSPNGRVLIAIALQPDASSLIATFFTGAVADGAGNSGGSALVPNVVVQSGPFLPCVNLPFNSGGAIFVHGFLFPDR